MLLKLRRLPRKHTHVIKETLDKFRVARWLTRLETLAVLDERTGSELDLELVQIVVGLHDNGDPFVECRGALDVDEELAKIRLEAARELVDFDLFGPVDVREALDVLVREVGGGALLRERTTEVMIWATSSSIDVEERQRRREQ